MKIHRRSSLTFIIFILLGLGFSTIHRDLVLFATPLVVYLVFGLLQVPSEPELTISRSPQHSRITEGTQLKIELLITNHGDRLEEVSIEETVPDSLQVLEGETRISAFLEKNETIQMTYTVLCTRGVHLFEGLKVKISNSFGLGVHEKYYRVRGWIRVIPDVRPLRRIRIHPRRTKVYSGTNPTRLGGVGVEFYGVRPFEFGDPLRWINWRATAKRQFQIVLNEYLQERVADIGVLVDGRKRANYLSPGKSTFNENLRAAATITDAFIGMGNRVGLLVFGRHLDWTYPGYGKIQQEKILRALSRSEEGESQVFDQLVNLPTNVFPPNTQLILISPLGEDDIEALLQLKRKGFEILIISVNPLTRLKSIYRGLPDINLSFRIVEIERRLISKQALQAGIQIVHWDVEESLEGALNAQLSRPHHWYQAIRGRE